LEAPPSKSLTDLLKDNLNNWEATTDQESIMERSKNLQAMFKNLETKIFDDPKQPW